MDEKTRERYVAWRRQRILKRIVVPSVLFVVVLVATIGSVRFLVRSSGERGATENEQDVLEFEQRDAEVSEIEEGEANATNASAALTNDGEIAAEPVPFCGVADPELATVLSTEEALSYAALVNRCYRLASDFVPHDLSVVNVAGVNFPFGSNHHELRETPARALEALFQEAEENELTLLLSSAYRSYDMQVTYHNSAITRAGGNLEEARRFSAVPGHSEHQLGLGVDLTTPALEGVWLDVSFAQTPEGQWVAENAHRFGFIVSFPYGREGDTAIVYEPWHIRYVGVEIATVMHQNGYVLEEYLWYNR